jgi:preprotein translocase subunit YajC
MSSFLALLAADNNSGGGSIISFLFIPLMLAAAYFLLIRPQRRRARDQVTLQSGLQVGDEVVTTSGIYGFITGFDGDVIWLEIDDNIQIRVVRGAVARKVDTSAAAPTTKNDAHVDEVIEEDKSDK